MRRLAACILVWAFGAAGCATGTRIITEPAGATVYVNGALIGRSPVVYENPKGLPRRYHVEAYRAGCRPLDFYLDTQMSYLWGVLGAITLVPKLWAWSLRDEYVFVLQPGQRDQYRCEPRVEDVPHGRSGESVPYEYDEGYDDDAGYYYDDVGAPDVR